MRILVAVLVLANVAWFAWSHWIEPPEPARAASSRPDGQSLVLAREAPPQPAAPVPTARTTDHCLSLGPFTDLTDAARASTLLRENELDPRQRTGEGVVWKGFWVALDGLPDRAAASGVIERLRRFGIGDAYAMPGDGGRTTVSLGLFSERQRALRRLDDVKALGLEPRITERERRGTVYWIDVDVEPPAQLPDAARLHGEGGRILRLEIRPCGS
ncbi:MAG: hypothetical protein ACT4UP_03995 [Gammaproteobacteria bacterium]